MNATNGTTSSSGSLGALRQRVDEFVGLFFYGTLLKSAQDHPLTESKYGFGGRGEQAFRAQLDQELASRAGRSGGNKLTEAIVRRLNSGRQASPSGPAAQAAPTAPTAVGGLLRSARTYDVPALAQHQLDVTHE